MRPTPVLRVIGPFEIGPAQWTKPRPELDSRIAVDRRFETAAAARADDAAGVRQV